MTPFFPRLPLAETIVASGHWVMWMASLVVGAYLCGSIPFGFLVGLVKGVDIRTKGSHNIGATNAGRVLGKNYFYIVLALDLAKGFAPTLAAGWVLGRSGMLSGSPVAGTALWLTVAFAAVAGHNWPCWLGFKGGKGVATSLGVVLAIYPYYTWPGLIAFVVWIIVVALTRYVSVGSITAAIVFIASLGVLFAVRDDWRLADQWPLLAFAAAMITILIWRHRTNLRRLREGTENKFMEPVEGTRHSREGGSLDAHE